MFVLTGIDLTYADVIISSQILFNYIWFAVSRKCENTMVSCTVTEFMFMPWVLLGVFALGAKINK